MIRDQSDQRSECSKIRDPTRVTRRARGLGIGTARSADCASGGKSHRSRIESGGSTAHVGTPTVHHTCRIQGCTRRATDTEHGNRTLCCDRCSRTDGRFHTAACDAADYDSSAPSSSTVSAPVGTTDRNTFVPGWHNYNSNEQSYRKFK